MLGVKYSFYKMEVTSSFVKALQSLAKRESYPHQKCNISKNLFKWRGKMV